MNSMKRFLALSMASLMIVGGSVSVGARKFDDVANDHSFGEQIDLLSEIGVIQGTTDTTYGPELAVTREQMSLLLYRMMLGDDNAGKINTSSFTDLTDPTYFGAISWAAANEYILGRGENKFDPRGGITFQDGITMLVRMLGHETERMNRGYPWTYIDAGVKLGLTAGLEGISYTATLTRGQIAGLLYNALTADYLIQKNVSGNLYYETSTVIEEVFGYEIEEAILTATNNFALPGQSKVVKNGYVALTYTETVGDAQVERTIYVNYDELDLKTDADAKLGERIKVIFTMDDKTRLVTVLGALEQGSTETHDTMKVESSNKYVEIDGVRYHVVPSYSDVLGTNNNELLVFKFNAGGTMTQITSNAGLAGLAGFFEIEMIHDDNTGVAKRALIKPYLLGRLELDRNGKVNLAGGEALKDITFNNPMNAQFGDHVLYFYNTATKTLDVKQPVELIEGALVTRLTATEATVGGVDYTLGKSGTLITANSIARHLTVGRKANILVYQGHIIGVSETVESTNSSKYLIATGTPTPVFTDGAIRYFMTANLDGVTTGIFVRSDEVTVGDVYRYVIDNNGIYTLIPMAIEEGKIETGLGSFVQNGNGQNEHAVHVETTDTMTITRGDSFFYTMDIGSSTLTGTSGLTAPVSFLTDDNTVILVKTENGIVAKTGTYTSTITVADGASVTAVFADRPGSIEMLRFLYISDGSLGSVNEGAAFAKVYSVVGLEFVDGNVVTAYKAYNFETGKMETMVSTYGSLSVGTTYAIDNLGQLSNITRENTTGIVTGYNGDIVTIGGEVYKLAEDATIHAVNGKLNVSNVNLEDLYMHEVEIFAEGREIFAILAGGALSFTAEAEEAVITVTPNLDITGIAEPTFELVSVTLDDEEMTAADFTLAASEGVMTLTHTETLADGDYTVKFRFFEQTFTVRCSVEAEVEAE